jgi:HK97 family phage prohead protease
MTDTETRIWPLQLELRGEPDGRTLEGAIVPYGQEARIGPSVVETFAPGAFAGTDPATLPLLALHDRQTLPIGRAVELRDQAAEWWGAFNVSRTRLGDEVLELVRDGALTGLSVGFLPVPGGDRWNATRTRVERVRARAHHVGVVPFPAYEGARIAAVRTAGPPPELYVPMLAKLAALLRRP